MRNGADVWWVRYSGLCVYLLLALLSLILASVDAKAQSTKPPAQSVRTPPVVVTFIKATGANPSGETFIRLAKEHLWNVYPLGRGSRQELRDYVVKGPDGPGLAFAAIALIPFHEPSDAEAVAHRAMDGRLSRTTRWHFLNVGPLILAVGDAWYEGEGDLDSEAGDFCKALIEEARAAARLGIGRWHARELRRLHDLPEKERVDPDYALTLWHQSAYLLGTLDLRDQQVLEPLFNPENGKAFANLLKALSLATAQDFVGELTQEEKAAIEDEARAARVAVTWWKDFLKRQPDGDWRPSAVSALARAGFTVEADMKSAVSQDALLRAIGSEFELVRYAAYRLLNETFETHFDLEAVFFAGKYALGPYDPSPDAAANAVRLQRYWQTRLKRSN